MIFDLVVKGGKIVTPSAVLEANLGVIDGKIAGLLDPRLTYEAKSEINAHGKFVMPGGIDPHVHGGHGEPHRETLATASMAAAAGGITTFIDMPLSAPSTVTLKAFMDKVEAVKKECVVDVALYGGLTPGHLADLEDVFNAGGQAFKAFMCRCSNYPMTDDGTLLAGMKILAELGGLVSVHAENDTLIHHLEEQFAAEGRNDVEAFIESHPIYSELEAIERFIFIAGLAPGCKAHIAHMSVPQGAEAVHYAKADGIDITVETCPQYLGLNEDDLRRIGGVAKCDPPLRPQECVDELWDYVLDGSIDMIASDHSPHTFAQKKVPMEQFDLAKQGCMGLTTMLPVVIDQGIVERGMSLPLYARFTALNCARRFGLYPQKGILAVGSDADFYLLDLESNWVCEAEKTFYINKHTPFDGREFRGHIQSTYVRGTQVYDGTNILVEPGYGQFVEMKMNE